LMSGHFLAIRLYSIYFDVKGNDHITPDSQRPHRGSTSAMGRSRMG
jgi:hypothetical protein